MITITLNMEEANVLAQLIDLAVKAGGVRVAQPAAVLMQKLEEAAKSNEENKEPEA